ncbi:MAG TPA: NDP-sugar synthase [Actinomycetota bacterium]|nr:NDP-sugar synthase [Actinomycetota bacterium]
MIRPTLVVFAAGKGTRLSPLTARTPKAMAPVLDVPLVDLALARGDGVGWAGRVVNISHPSAGLADHLRSREGVTVFDEGAEPVGTAATLRCLLPRLSETVVTYNCDLVSTLDLGRLLEFHSRAAKPCTLAVRPVDRNGDLACEQGVLRLIDRRIEDRPGLLFLGAAVFDRALLQDIPDTQPLGLTAGLLRRVVDAQQVGLFEHPGYGRDAGSLDRYLQVNLDALDRGLLPVDAPGTVSPEGWYTGPGAEAEQESLGSGAVVLAGARIGPGARLKNCLVWPGSFVPAGTVCEGGIWFEGALLTG